MHVRAWDSTQFPSLLISEAARRAICWFNRIVINSITDATGQARMVAWETWCAGSEVKDGLVAATPVVLQCNLYDVWPPAKGAFSDEEE